MPRTVDAFAAKFIGGNVLSRGAIRMTRGECIASCDSSRMALQSRGKRRDWRARRQLQWARARYMSSLYIHRV